jgi:putative SOS response-associated peptidase YedK
MFNARAETLSSSPAFRDAFVRKRCLVPVDGFYEWKREGTARQPFLIGRADGLPLTLAGLWSGWRDPATERVVRTFTIITSGPNDQMVDIHNRMPVVVPEELWPMWLDPLADRSELRAILEPNDDTTLLVRPVSRLVNNVRNDGPALIEPMAPEGTDHPSAVAMPGFFD